MSRSVSRFFAAALLSLMVLVPTAPVTAAEGEVGFFRRAEHRSIVEAYGGTYDEPNLLHYVRTIGGWVVKHTDRPDEPFQFFILDSPEPNAFALQDTYAYITRGMLALISDEAELAAVLSHEIAHVTAGHIGARRESLVALGLSSMFLSMAAGREIDVSPLMRTLWRYNRFQEVEADKMAVRFTRAAGYDPTRVFAMLNRIRGFEVILQRLGTAVDYQSDDATHPKYEQRFDAVRDSLIRYGPVTTVGVRNPEQFQKFTNRLLFDVLPKRGAVRVAYHRAKAGDTIAKLAKRLPFGADSKLWVRVLNGWDPEDRPIPGTMVKLLVLDRR